MNGLSRLAGLTGVAEPTGWPVEPGPGAQYRAGTRGPREQRVIRHGPRGLADRGAGCDRDRISRKQFTYGGAQGIPTRGRDPDRGEVFADPVAALAEEMAERRVESSDLVEDLAGHLQKEGVGNRDDAIQGGAGPRQ